MSVTLLKFLFAWANAPYAIALGTVLLFALLQASGLLGLLAGGDHDADGGDDVDGGDADGHDVEAHEAAHDGGDAHDGDADHDGDHENESESRGVGVLLAPLGIGKLPFSLVWQVYGAVFALTGFALNARWVTSAAGGAPPLVSLAWTMPLAFGVGYGVVAALAKLLAPIFVNERAEATSRAELVGQVGTVISTKVDGDFGEVKIRDKTGHDLRIVCKLAQGHRAAREGESVVVLEHDNGNLYVASMEEALVESEPEEREKSDVRG